MRNFLPKGTVFIYVLREQMVQTVIGCGRRRRLCAYDDISALDHGSGQNNRISGGGDCGDSLAVFSFCIGNGSFASSG